MKTTEPGTIYVAPLGSPPLLTTADYGVPTLPEWCRYCRADSLDVTEDRFARTAIADFTPTEVSVYAIRFAHAFGNGPVPYVMLGWRPDALPNRIVIWARTKLPPLERPANLNLF